MDADSRDAYGFAVRPQQLQRYREYAKIYKEEEEERTNKWKDFLERLSKSTGEALAAEGGTREVPSATGREDNEQSEVSDTHDLEEITASESVKEAGTHKVQIWSHIRPSLASIEQMMSYRVNKQVRNEQEVGSGPCIDLVEESGVDVGRSSGGAPREELEEEFFDVERPTPIQEASMSDSGNAGSVVSHVKDELESLVRGGAPMDLRGELWQAFVGVGKHRIEGYYSELLAQDVDIDNDQELDVSNLCDTSHTPKTPSRCYPEKWRGQIEKDLPRTFPGHPALDEHGRNALRRLLTAYARHNPSVGYCQAMNFFAGLLLLMMPEENAFWTLLGIIDNYFDGYYTEEMVESQVDQLVLEDLAREKFPKLVNHLDYLEVQVAWVTGPWFLSIFVNMLPWESVLRVWDVFLFDGNRVMLFRTALALMELYGPALVTTKDAADALTLLKSLAGSTFDSSQLVLTACMGYQGINEMKLQDLRKNHRPAVLAAMDDKANGLDTLKDPKALASKLYSFTHHPGSLIAETNSSDGLRNFQINGDLNLLKTGALDGYLNSELDSVPDLHEQVTWLKAELCRLLEEKRSAVLRAEELETKLMDMVRQDNRRLLSAKIEQQEEEVSQLRQALSSKQEQEQAMLKVLMRMEQEQKVTADARASAEQDAAAQKYAAYVLQEKYEEAMAALAQMEKRAVMAESKLEATLQQQSSPIKADQVSSSPRKLGLLSRPFGLGWLDKNKGKSNNTDEPITTGIPTDAGPNLTAEEKDLNGIST